jgi:hypothetical protein
MFLFCSTLHDSLGDIGQHKLAVLIVRLDGYLHKTVAGITLYAGGDGRLACQNTLGKKS